MKTDIFSTRSKDLENVTCKELLEDAEQIAQLGTWSRDLVTGKLSWSAGAYNIFGFSQATSGLTFDKFISVVHPDDKPYLLNELKVSAEEKRNFDVEYRMTRADGQRRVLHVRGRFYADENQVIVRSVGVIQDVTDARRQEKVVLEHQRILIQSEKMMALGTITAGVAHEINNPLTIILGSLGLLNELRTDSEKYQKQIGTIDKNIKRILKIVSSLKKYSRGHDKPIFVPASLAKIVEEVLFLAAGKSKSASTPISADCKFVDDIFCDEMQIEQVLLNLVINGIDAVKSLPEKWVRISLFADGEAVVLQVRDSGNGIPKDIQNKIFLPFMTTKPPGEGTGLGLSIVKEILDVHDAKIAISENDPNTCFEIRFKKSK